MRKFLPILLLVLASPAAASVWSGTCTFSANLTVGSGATKYIVNSKDRACFRFTSADTVPSASTTISVGAGSALWCFDPDNTDAVADTSRVIVHYCPSDNAAGGTGSANTCIALGGANGNASLDGTEGASTTQNACIRTGPGIFYIEISAACAKASTDYCEVSVKGEEAAP